MADQISIYTITNEQKFHLSSLIIEAFDHVVIVDPALNQDAILSYLETKQLMNRAVEIWLSSSLMLAAPYVNELSTALDTKVYAPYQFLSEYRLFPDQAKVHNLCGVYQPKIKQDLGKRVFENLLFNVKLFDFSKAVIIYLEQVNKVWLQKTCLNENDLIRLNTVLKETGATVIE